MANLTRYTEEQIERGLNVLALSNGNHRLAASRLEEIGHGMPSTTLDSWRRERFPERYQQIRQRLLPRIQEQMAQESEELAAAYAAKEWDLLEALDPAKLEGRDVANALRNAATARAISMEKGKLYRDQPTQIVEQRSAPDILKELRSRSKAVDVESEDITDVHVLPAVRPEPNDKRAPADAVPA